MKIEVPGQFFLSTVIGKWWIVFDTQDILGAFFKTDLYGVWPCISIENKGFDLSYCCQVASDL